MQPAEACPANEAFTPWPATTLEIADKPGQPLGGHSRIPENEPGRSAPGAPMSKGGAARRKARPRQRRGSGSQTISTRLAGPIVAACQETHSAGQPGLSFVLAALVFDGEHRRLAAGQQRGHGA